MNHRLKPTEMSSNRKTVVEDRLSTLPDPILVHILTFLPTLNAARTMLLKPFGDLWTLLPNLDFDDSAFDKFQYYYRPCDDEDDDGCTTLNLAFFSFVRNVLTRHRSPKITHFRVQITDTFYQDIDDGNLSHELDACINFALRKNVESLEFYVGVVEPCELLYKLPNAEFVCDSVTELKLEYLEMTLQTRVQMRFLRVLRLVRVEISDSVLQEIVRGCRLLKELEIWNCFSLTEVGFDAPNVEILILDTSEHYEFGPVVNCPNLRSFQYTGFINCVEVKDLSSLVDVAFDLSSHLLEFKEFDQFMTALKPVLGAQTVSFSCEFVTVLFYCMLKHLPQSSMNWKRVELSIWMTEKHVPGLIRLFRSSPYLEELVLNVTSLQRDFLEPIEAEIGNWSIDDENCFSTSLKSVVIYNVSMCSYTSLVHLVSRLLNKAYVLAELVIHYKTNDKPLHDAVLSPEEWTEFSNKLPTFPKSSQDVRILLL